MLAPPNRGYASCSERCLAVKALLTRFVAACRIRYHKSMKKYVGVAGYGGVAAEELATLSADELDARLGKLPRRCYPLVLAGKLSLNPFNQHNYPNDGLVMVEETELPGEFRHQVREARLVSWQRATCFSLELGLLGGRLLEHRTTCYRRIP